MSHRREQKERLRAQRAERERAAQEAARRKRRLGYVAGGALAVAAVAILVLVVASGAGGGGSGSFPSGSVPDRRVVDLQAAARAAGCTVREFKSEGQRHVEGEVRYRSTPPHSGNHNQVPADDGAYAERIDDENLVHALEHGRVVYWFNPGAPARIKGDLKALFDQDDYHVLLAPSERRMPYQVAASAWTQVLGCKRFTERTFDALRKARRRAGRGLGGGVGADRTRTGPLSAADRERHQSAHQHAAECQTGRDSARRG